MQAQNGPFIGDDTSNDDNGVVFGALTMRSITQDEHNDDVQNGASVIDDVPVSDNSQVAALCPVKTANN